MRRNGERKLKGELDLSKILKKVRNFNTAFDYLFSERQKFLFKFNDRHVIDSNSDLITPDSEESLFSGTSDEDLKNKSMKQKVMMKLLDDVDPRNDDCAHRLIDRDLFRGVGRNFKTDSTLQEEKSSSNMSSQMVDSDRIAREVKFMADEDEIKPDVLVDAEATPRSSQMQDSSHVQSDKDNDESD